MVRRLLLTFLAVYVLVVTAMLVQLLSNPSKSKQTIVFA